jgi:NAD-dependent SIR2 family protein deacetylase
VSVVTPTEGIDPRVALASSIQASPGVYALLIGSGMSSAAGIPTGWQIVQRLARHVAVLDGVDLDDDPDAAIEWYAATYGHEPRYEELLERLASTEHTRRALLREFFEQPPGASGPIEPTNAHRVVGDHCAQGRVKVILTTNFDHLLERALEDAGVGAQVLITPSDLEGMEPLQHARTTVIKLHGDYSKAMRNTEEELGAYEADLEALLDNVLDCYGLIVVGWSAEYDRALEGRISASKSRRYPMYWLRHEGGAATSKEAAALIAKRNATPIDINGADEFFTDLQARLQRLDNIAVRRQQPAALWVYHRPPNVTNPPSGWAALPLLQLRSAVDVFAPLDACSPIGPGDREAIVAALEDARFSEHLWALSGRDLVVSALEPTPPDKFFKSLPLGNWGPTPGGHQSLQSASYGLGGDASMGLSSILEIWLPRPGNGAVTITLDTGVSLHGGLLIEDAVVLWQSGLMLLTGPLLDALRTIVPHDAEVSQVEIHVAAPATSGQGHDRATGLIEQLNLRVFGEPTDRPPATVGQAMRVDGALELGPARELVIDAVERMMLNLGFLDPRPGIKAIREKVAAQQPD